jgi:lysophospholipase L1-like esterase
MRILALALLLFTLPLAAAEQLLPGIRRIVFLGDSITYAGNYVDQFEAYLAVAVPDREFEVIDVGLPSETVSGLSEPGHADGKFPRPDLHERLERVLEKTRPDLVIACYGMNDGIYQPFAEKRLRAFREGMKKLHDTAVAKNIQIIHLTPPVFDSEPIRDKVDPTGDKEGAQFAGYDDVLARYSQWLVSKRAEGWRVVDVHTPLRRALDSRRAAEPGFAFAKDGVHPSEAGHWIISSELIADLAGENRGAALDTVNQLRDAHSAELLRLIRERGRITTDAWLSNTGHTRPGMNPGLPLEEARTKADKMGPKIHKQAAGVAKILTAKPS